MKDKKKQKSENLARGIERSFRIFLVTACYSEFYNNLQD